MNREEATLTLSKILAKAGHIKIEKDALIPYYLQNSISAVLIKNSGPNKFYTVNVWEYYPEHNPPYKEFLEKMRQKLTEEANALAKKIGANYLFISREKTVSLRNEEYEDLITAFALIGHSEVQKLKEVLAGDLSEKVAKAAEELGIDISVDYNALLRTNPPEFRRYFTATSEKKQIEVVGGILKLNETINQEIMAWLEENYASIIRYAGVMGVGKK